MVRLNKYITFILIFSSLSHGAVIFVDNQLPDDCVGTYSIANRDCSGSDGDAYNTAQEAADVSAPGDIIYFRAGTYYSRVDTAARVPVLRVIISGTVANPITYKNYNNEEVILTAWDEENTRRKYYSVELGDQPNSSVETLTGEGVQNITIEGLIIEGGSYAGLGIFGPADAYNDPDNPTENVTISHVIARYNTGVVGKGITSQGTLINVTIEYCEAYVNQSGGISYGRIAKFWHDPEPDNLQSAARYSTISNCLCYNNDNPENPGNTDGLGGSNMYRCIVENNVAFNNSDDGMDIYASIEVAVRNNLVFGQYGCLDDYFDDGTIYNKIIADGVYEEGYDESGFTSAWTTAGNTIHKYERYREYTNIIEEWLTNYVDFIGNGCGIKFAAGGGGRHTISGNVIFSNKGYSLEGSAPSNPQRIYYPSKLLNNIAYKGRTGIATGHGYTTYTGYEKPYLRNNALIDNTADDIWRSDPDWLDSDYNFISSADKLQNLQDEDQDIHSLTGDPQLANLGVIIDTSFDSVWIIEVKLNHIRSQVKAAFSPLQESILVDAGTVIDGFHNPTAGSGAGEVWYGNAPDMGAYDYVPTDPDLQHVLSVSSTGGGSVTNPGEGDFQRDDGTVVSIQAVAGDGYHFVSWTGTAVVAGKVTNPNAASTTVTVDADYTIQANFAVGQPHNLMISSTSGGTVTTPGEGTYVYENGTEISVVAAPEANSHFVNWTGTAFNAGQVADPDSASTTVTMDADYTLRANFSIEQHDLTITSTPGGTVTTPGEGIYPYDHGAAASVVAAPAANYHFVNWTGTAVGADKVAHANAASTTVTVDADYTIQANFAADQHTLTISSAGGGSVTDPGEGPFLYDHDHGTGVSIQATAGGSSYFVSWTGTAVAADKVANPNAASTTVTVDADYTIQALFGESDGIAPTVTNCLPDVNDIQAPLNSLITLHVTDTLGVAAGSVTITLDGNTIYTGDTSEYSSANGICRRAGTPANYTYAYQSNQAFDFDQSKTVTVNAADLAGNVMNELSYSFTTEMRSFGQNKQVSLGLNNLNSSKPKTVCDSSGNIWAVWHAGPVGSRNIYVGKLAAGADTFGTSVQIRSNSSDQANPAIALGTDDKLYVVWQDNRQEDDNNQGEWDIYISTSVGGIDWSEERRVNDPNEDNQVNPAIVVDSRSPNYAYVVWQDDHAGNQDICIATSSDSFVTKTVSQITSNTSYQTTPAIAVDSANTVYVLWTDARNGSNDIYGAASSGWTNVAIVTKAASQSSPAIAVESTGSILHMLWVDQISGNSDIYYDSSNGLPGSPLAGTNLIDDTLGAEQISPVIAVTGSTGDNLQVFTCWHDERNISDNTGDTDLYMVQTNSGVGINVFVGDGGTNSDQIEPAMSTDQYGYPYLVWTDDRSTNMEIYFAESIFMEPSALVSSLTTASSGGTVGTDPGSITGVDDVSVVLPEGACPYDVTVSITKIDNQSEYGSLPCLNGYDFGPSGITFNTPVTITIPYAVTSAAGTPTVYWYDSSAWYNPISQQGITNIERIVITSSLHALRFKTTHFTPYYVVLGSATDIVTNTVADTISSSGGGGGGCSLSHSQDGSILEYVLPYGALALFMFILKRRDRRYIEK